MTATTTTTVRVARCMSCQTGWHGSCRGEAGRPFYDGQPCACAAYYREHQDELRSLRAQVGVVPGSVLHHLR